MNENVYVVSYHTWNSEYRNHEDVILRIYRKLDNAIKYVSEWTNFSIEDIAELWDNGYLDIQCYDRVYCIEECVLEE